MKNIDLETLTNLIQEFFGKRKVTFSKMENNRYNDGETELTFHVDLIAENQE